MKIKDLINFKKGKATKSKYRHYYENNTQLDFEKKNGYYYENNTQLDFEKKNAE